MRIIVLISCLIFLAFNSFAQPVSFNRDPFAEITDLTILDAESGEVRSLSIKLTGIIFDDKNPAAVLNVSGKTYVVYKNTPILWVTVVRISSSSVVLEGNDKEYMLTLGEEIAL